MVEGCFVSVMCKSKSGFGFKSGFKHILAGFGFGLGFEVPGFAHHCFVCVTIKIIPLGHIFESFDGLSSVIELPKDVIVDFRK